MQTRLNVIINSSELCQIQGVMQLLSADVLVEEIKKVLPHHTVGTFVDAHDHERLTLLITDKHNG